jgi:ribosome maturation factor RimP
MSTKESIRPELQGPLAALGLLVEDVTVSPAGKRRLVRVWVDRALPPFRGDTTDPVPPLSLDEVADATRVISDALDASDALGEQPYTLEVTSPGVDRPLTEPRHFRRNVSRLVSLTTTDGQSVTGRITSAGDTGLTLQVPATRKAPARSAEVPYAAIARAAVQVEFSRGPAGAAGADGADDADGADGADDETPTEES